MAKFRKRPVEKMIDAIKFDGDNVIDIWDEFGAEGIYGPTETNPDHLLLTTIDDVQVPCPIGHWVIAEPVPNRFYPCHPDVFADTYELADE